MRLSRSRQSCRAFARCLERELPETRGSGAGLLLALACLSSAELTGNLRIFSPYESLFRERTEIYASISHLSRLCSPKGLFERDLARPRYNLGPSHGEKFESRIRGVAGAWSSRSADVLW